MALVEGLDPDLEWLVKYEPYIAPDYDSRVFVDRKSTRLNSSHTVISYAVFCLKKKKNKKSEQAMHNCSE